QGAGGGRVGAGGGPRGVGPPGRVGGGARRADRRMPLPHRSSWPAGSALGLTLPRGAPGRAVVVRLAIRAWEAAGVRFGFEAELWLGEARREGRLRLAFVPAEGSAEAARPMGRGAPRC